MSSTPENRQAHGQQTRTRQDIMVALHAAMREASAQGVLYSQAVAARLGINSTDLECLDHIVLRGSLTAGALAEATGLTTGAITGVIDRLEQAGFARREPDPGDRRKVVVRATDAVGERIGPLYEPMARATMAALASYRDNELALLLDFFARARAAIPTAMSELRAMPKPKPHPRRVETD
jgi:DNA-binding MarR family transcriptional regulator